MVYFVFIIQSRKILRTVFAKLNEELMLFALLVFTNKGFILVVRRRAIVRIFVRKLV
jgi:hypothetical protein